MNRFRTQVPAILFLVLCLGIMLGGPAAGAGSAGAVSQVYLGAWVGSQSTSRATWMPSSRS